MFAVQHERRPRRFQSKGPNRRVGGVSPKLHQEKLVLPFRTQRRAGIVNHARGAVVEILDGWNEVGGLPFLTRLEHLLVHPDFIVVVFGVGVLAVLPVGAPARVGAVHDVHQPLAFARMVAVVVGTDEVAVLVEHELVGVAQARSKYFKISSVWVRPDDYALVGIAVFVPLHVGKISSDVADTPVNPPVGAFHRARHTMTAEADVDAEAVGDGSFLV